MSNERVRGTSLLGLAAVGAYEFEATEFVAGVITAERLAAEAAKERAKLGLPRWGAYLGTPKSEENPLERLWREATR